MTEIAEKINCPSCGAPLDLKPGEVIITCEYCGSAHNMAVGKKYFLKHSIIPNSYDKGQVEMIVRDWMGHGFLKPDDLARASKIMEMNLTFMPFFVFHVKARSDYKGAFTRTGQNLPREGVLEKEYFWKIIGRRGSKFPTKEYEIPLSGKVDFDLSKVAKDAKFLNAEMDEGEAKGLADQEIGEHQLFLLQEQVDTFERLKTDVETVNTEFVHAPVWQIRYQYHDRLYSLLIDGASGAVIRGDIPQKEKGGKGLFGKMKKGFF